MFELDKTDYEIAIKIDKIQENIQNRNIRCFICFLVWCTVSLVCPIFIIVVTAILLYMLCAQINDESTIKILKMRL